MVLVLQKDPEGRFNSNITLLTFDIVVQSFHTLSRVKKKKKNEKRKGLCSILTVEQLEASLFVEHQNSVRQLIDS